MTPLATLQGIGTTFDIPAPVSEFLRKDSVWRLAHHYGPALTASSLDRCGLAIDVGAGFGAFSLPFVRAYPQWRVLAFEPDPSSFEALVANTESRIVPLPIAIGGIDVQPKDREAVRSCLRRILAGEPADELVQLLPRRTFYRAKSARPKLSQQLRCILEGGFFNVSNILSRLRDLGQSEDLGYMQENRLRNATRVSFPVLAADLLDAVEPTFLKLTAPLSEQAILEAFSNIPIDHIIGETWSHVQWNTVCHARLPGRRETWLPVAGPGLLAIRHVPQTSELRPGLDVIVNLEKDQDEKLSFLTGVLDSECDDVRVILVSTGINDDRRTRLAERFANNLRVEFLDKSGQSPAVARNSARRHSRASHISFIDANETLTTGIFTDLLELARQTGAEIVRAPTALPTPNRSFKRENNLKTEDLSEGSEAFRHTLGDQRCHIVRSTKLACHDPSFSCFVYSRPFLDTMALWFPESLSWHDRLAFHLITLHSVRDVPVLEKVAYVLRVKSTPNPTLHFEVLEAFRFAFVRGLDEAWKEIDRLWQAFEATFELIDPLLTGSLNTRFYDRAAKLWAIALLLVPAPAPPEKIASRIAVLTRQLGSVSKSEAYRQLRDLEWE